MAIQFIKGALEKAYLPGFFSEQAKVSKETFQMIVF